MLNDKGIEIKVGQRYDFLVKDIRQTICEITNLFANGENIDTNDIGVVDLQEFTDYFVEHPEEDAVEIDNFNECYHYLEGQDRPE